MYETTTPNEQTTRTEVTESYKEINLDGREAVIAKKLQPLGRSFE